MSTLTLASSTVAAVPTVVNLPMVCTYTDSDTTDTFTIKIALAGLTTPPPVTLTGTGVNASPTLTLASGGLGTRKGDVVTSAIAGIPAGTSVLAINSATSLTLSNNLTAALTAAAVIATPPAPTGEVFFLSGALTQSGSASGALDNQTLIVDVLRFPGDGKAAPLITDGQKVGSVQAAVNISNYRVGQRQ